MDVWARQRRRIESVEGENIRKRWATIKELFVVYSVIDDIFVKYYIIIVNRNKKSKNRTLQRAKRSNWYPN